MRSVSGRGRSVFVIVSGTTAGTTPGAVVIGEIGLRIGQVKPTRLVMDLFEIILCINIGRR